MAPHPELNRGRTGPRFVMRSQRNSGSPPPNIMPRLTLSTRRVDGPNQPRKSNDVEFNSARKPTGGGSHTRPQSHKSTPTGSPQWRRNQQHQPPRASPSPSRDQPQREPLPVAQSSKLNPSAPVFEMTHSVAESAVPYTGPPFEYFPGHGPLGLSGDASHFYMAPSLVPYYPLYYNAEQPQPVLMMDPSMAAFGQGAVFGQLPYSPMAPSAGFPVMSPPGAMTYYRMYEPAWQPGMAQFALDQVPGPIVEPEGQLQYRQASPPPPYSLCTGGPCALAPSSSNGWSESGGPVPIARGSYRGRFNRRNWRLGRGDSDYGCGR